MVLHTCSCILFFLTANVSLDLDFYLPPPLGTVITWGRFHSSESIMLLVFHHTARWPKKLNGLMQAVCKLARIF